jgi:hypothetical protein
MTPEYGLILNNENIFFINIFQDLKIISKIQNIFQGNIFLSD